MLICMHAVVGRPKTSHHDKPGRSDTPGFRSLGYDYTRRGVFTTEKVRGKKRTNEFRLSPKKTATDVSQGKDESGERWRRREGVRTFSSKGLMSNGLRQRGAILACETHTYNTSVGRLARLRLKE